MAFSLEFPKVFLKRTIFSHRSEIFGKKNTKYHQFQNEVFHLKHIITWNASAHSLCSSSPKFLFIILATPFSKVFIWLCDGLTKVHNNNSSKIISIPQKLNVILKSRYYFISVGLAPVLFYSLFVYCTHYCNYTLRYFWFNDIYFIGAIIYCFKGIK